MTWKATILSVKWLFLFFQDKGQHCIMLTSVLLICFLYLDTAIADAENISLQERYVDDLKSEDRWFFSWGSDDEKLEEPEPCYGIYPTR